MRALNELVRNGKGEYLSGDGKTFTTADIAAVCAVAQDDFSGVRPERKKLYLDLAEWWRAMDARENFASTRPAMFDIKTDKVVRTRRDPERFVNALLH